MRASSAAALAQEAAQHRVDVALGVPALQQPAGAHRLVDDRVLGVAAGLERIERAPEQRLDAADRALARRESSPHDRLHAPVAAQRAVRQVDAARRAASRCLPRRRARTRRRGSRPPATRATICAASRSAPASRCELTRSARPAASGRPRRNARRIEPLAAGALQLDDRERAFAAGDDQRRGSALQDSPGLAVARRRRARARSSAARRRAACCARRRD